MFHSDVKLSGGQCCVSFPFSRPCFGTRISAFVLVCGHVLADVGLFALALVFLVMAFAILGCLGSEGMKNPISWDRNGKPIKQPYIYIMIIMIIIIVYYYYCYIIIVY